MSKLDDDIRKALATGQGAYELERADGVFRQMAGLYQGELRWMAVAVTIHLLVILALMVWVASAFFRSADTKAQILYATCFVLLGLALTLAKLWGWMLMNRYALQREIKRVELRLVELTESRRE